MTVVGMDTSSHGWHAVSTETVEMPQGPETYGWLTPGGATAAERRQPIFHETVRFFEGLPDGTWVFAEEPLVLRTNTETTRKLVMIGGILEAALFQSNADIVFNWVDVSTWRRCVLGKGGGRKEEMKRLAELWVEMADRSWLDRDKAWVFAGEPDLYDAACICEYGRLVCEGL